MKTNFTPGPWDCISKKEHEKICRKYPAAYMVVPITCVGDKMVMPLTTALRWLPERRKNAYLIAAAPEMYEMLKCISDWCAKNPGQWVVTKSEVDEVLKKARGE